MIKGYYQPTPTKMRKLGDALLAASVTVTTFAIAADYKWVAISACIIGTLGKFLTNFFTITPEDIQQGEIVKDKVIWTPKKKTN